MEVVVFHKKCCSGSKAEYIHVCRHVFNKKAKEGVKRFIGHGVQVEYRCEQCIDDSIQLNHSLCTSCIEEIEEQGYWTYDGVPVHDYRPEKFAFSSRLLKIPDLNNEQIIAITPFNKHLSLVLLFTLSGRIFQLDISNGRISKIAEYSSEDIRAEGTVQLVVSGDDEYFALSSRALTTEKEKAYNYGLVARTEDGSIVLKLDCGDYHTEQIEFPVTFFSHKNKTLIIHATDWDRLDITDPLSGKCLTERNLEELEKFSEEEKEDAAFTEWSGQMKVSPDQKLLASTGWVWHPVGLVYSFSLHNWIEDNVWESDIGRSKKSYTVWDYFWEAPFFWIDNQKLCIWGHYPLESVNSDIPLNSAAIYEAQSEKLLKWFYGPTADLFVFDKYLFSSNLSNDGITVWDIDQGCLLHEEKGISAIAYHPVAKEFIDIDESGEIKLHRWEKLL